MIWHPESAGRAHIVGMIDAFLGKLAGRMAAAEPGEITFETMASVASSWKQAPAV
jgi:protocatechuate 3,4-dioxygenase beta subunit